jgi:signal transduction histidine kinase
VKIVTYFSELDERTCELVANSAALAIQNARLMEARHNIEINALGRAAAMFAKQLGEVLPIVNAKLTSLIERHAFLVREELESKTRQAHDLLNYLSAIKESLLALKHDLGLPAETLQTVLNLVAEADTIVLKLCDYLLPHSREHSRDRGRPPHTPPLPDDLHNAQEYLERAQQIVEEFGSFATESFTLPDIVAPRELVDDLVIHVKAALGAGATVCKSQSAQGIGSIPVNLRSLKSVFMHLARDSRCLKSHGLVVTISAHDASDEDLRRVRLRSDDRYLKLVYADNGPGVRQDHKAIIFYPRTSIREGGSGLGLAIAARVARAHGGCVVENGKPRPEGAQGDDYGARFEFYLGGGQTL